MPHTHHAIDYVEMDVPDLTAARDFYTAAFGWQYNDYGPDYSGIRSPDASREAGGFNRSDDATAGSGPLVLMYSDDLDATLEAVRAAGGTVTSGPYDFPGGRRFHFRDPSGYELGVWQEG